MNRALMLLLTAVGLGTSRELASAHQLVLITSVVRNQWVLTRARKRVF